MSRSPSLYSGFLLVAAALLGAQSARADDTNGVSARLVWEREPGAESCIDRAGLETAVNRRWQRHVFVEGEKADLVVVGRMRRGARDRWVASIEMRRADGTSLGDRELVTRAADCSALNDSVALALGIMLDVSRKRIAEERAAQAPAADTHGEGAASSPPPPVEPRPVAGPVISVPPEPPRARWHLEPFAAVEGIAFVMPRLDAGGRFGVAAIPPERFRVELSVSIYSAQDVSEVRPSAHFTGWAAELAAYPFGFASGSGRFRGDLGLGARLLALHAAGVGLFQTATADEAIAGLGPRAALAFRVAGPLSLLLGLGGDVLLSRYRFVYRDSAGGAVSVFRTGLFSAESFIGLALGL